MSSKLDPGPPPKARPATTASNRWTRPAAPRAPVVRQGRPSMATCQQRPGRPRRCRSRYEAPRQVLHQIEQHPLRAGRHHRIEAGPRRDRGTESGRLFVDQPQVGRQTQEWCPPGCLPPRCDNRTAINAKLDPGYAPPARPSGTPASLFLPA